VPDHPFLHRGDTISAVAGRAQVRLGDQGVLNIESEVCVERPLQPPTATSEEVTNTAQWQSASPEDLACADALAQAGGGSSLHHFVWIGPEHLPHRHRAEENSADQCQQHRDNVNLDVWIYL
jgi:hypothetical protein